MGENELLRALAKGTGWSVCPKNGQYELCYAPEEWCAFFETEADAWHYAEASVKDAPESVDAALALPWPWNDIADFSIDLSRTHAAVRMIVKPNNGEEYTGGGALLAAALCDVFAAWFEEHEKEAPHA